MKKNILLNLLLFMQLSGLLVAQTASLSDGIAWKKFIKVADDSGIINEYMSFDGAFTNIATNLPLYSHSIQLENLQSRIEGRFESMIFEPCSAEEISYLANLQYNEHEIKINTSVVVQRKIPQGVINFIPIRLNPETGIFEKLVEFSLDITIIAIDQQAIRSNRLYAENSVLSNGEWIKIRVSESGIYKIGYNDLVSYGLNPATIDPHTIQLFGNAMGMLPEKNSDFRYDDLQENAIYVSGEDDGTFDQQDYILFYGMSPNIWKAVQGVFNYSINLYDDYNYYFLTTSQESGQRILMQPSSALPPTRIQTKYSDYQVIENDEVNLIQSGKRWYGDIFGEVNTRDYNFHFPNLKADEQGVIKMEVANRTFINDQMTININNEFFDTISLTSVNISSTKFAQKKKKTVNFNISGGNDIHVNLQYLPASLSSNAWLDYITANVVCSLNFYNGQFSFRDLSTVMEGSITKFVISNSNSDVVVWDISDPIVPVKMESEYNSSETSFTLSTNNLHEFIAFDGSNYFTPEFVESIENQNLHGEGPYDYIIVSYPLFLEEANELAEIHRSIDGLSVKVVTPTEIYNEFSSGKQDPSAIRDYMKMLYDRFNGEEPRFLLLFGDGSYDPKNRIEGNSNLIPTFQTEESWITASSYVIDDFFGYLDDNEGEDAIGELDIGIGRFPVETNEEAAIVLGKIKRYISDAEPVFGNWRNRICLIADDEDGNLHLEQADSLANGAGYIPVLYNQQKIYIDAYTQVNTPSGYRYPDVTSDLNKSVDEGALIINYIGHGGITGWAHERILQIPDIVGWTNKDKLPLFITATCEFSRFDDPEMKTAGELVMLNPDGGGIALLTTTRLAYSQSNFTLNQRVYSTAFAQIGGEYPYFGDIIQKSKPPGQPTTRNFVLLGDPALKMAYPKFQVRTLSINNQQTQMQSDTLHSLDLIQISGDVADVAGTTLENFNGYVNIQVYDKKTQYKTKGNDSYSYPVKFYCQDKIIWQGKSTVTSGVFEFSFLVPKDIALNLGPGKISYYAWSENADASGYSNDITIGGINLNAPSDTQGPDIDLFLNDLSFVSGDQTDENPLMLAFVSDASGLNFSSGGLGHELIAVLDDDYTNVIRLKDYFEQDINSYTTGKINYPFYNLPDGSHTLTLKAWDNYNNSGEKTISFLINTNGTLEINQLVNYPNPFKNSTTFSFDHTRPGDKLEIILEIFDLTGKIVLTYENSFVADMTHTPFLVWNGDDLKGNRLKSGIYLYTLQVTDEDNNTSVQRQKLVLMN
jgi:hypothetical protein